MQLGIQVRELLLNFSDIRSIVHFWIPLELEESRVQPTQSLNAALSVYTRELVPNVLGGTMRQYKSATG
jgi:hypothetical protein